MRLLFDLVELSYPVVVGAVILEIMPEYRSKYCDSLEDAVAELSEAWAEPGLSAAYRGYKGPEHVYINDIYGFGTRALRVNYSNDGYFEIVREPSGVFNMYLDPPWRPGSAMDPKVVPQVPTMQNRFKYCTEGLVNLAHRIYTQAAARQTSGPVKWFQPFGADICGPCHRQLSADLSAIFDSNPDMPYPAAMIKAKHIQAHTSIVDIIGPDGVHLELNRVDRYKQENCTTKGGVHRITYEHNQ